LDPLRGNLSEVWGDEEGDLALGKTKNLKKVMFFLPIEEERPSALPPYVQEKKGLIKKCDGVKTK